MHVLYDGVERLANRRYDYCMKIYTRRGDSGQTDLFSGGEMHRIEKDSLRIEAIGDVDELNSFIGLSLTSNPESHVTNLLLEIQKDLFVLGADLATPVKQAVRGNDDVPRVSDIRISEFEKIMDDLSSELEPMTSFILPGGSTCAAQLHLCRSICRRAERTCVALMHEEAQNGRMMSDLPCKFLNRLSDLFFILARYENLKKNMAEVKWVG